MKITGKIISILTMLSLLILLGCKQPLLDENMAHTSGMGSFSLHITDDNLRTILPVLTKNDLMAYTLVFIGSVHVTENRTSANYSSPVYLPVGTYDLFVSAYLDTEMTKGPVAFGTVSEVTITAGAAASRTITLSALVGAGAGPGTFSWNINFPGEVTAAAMKVTPVDPAAITTEFTVNLLGAAAPHTKTGSTTISSGYYRVLFTLTMPGAKTLEWLEALHVYQLLDSNYTKNFTSEYFNSNVYTVTFDHNYDNIIEQQSVLHGNTLSAPTPAPTRTGYVFGGWYREAGLTNAWNFASDSVTANITLYAKWDVDPATLCSCGAPPSEGLKYRLFDGGVAYMVSKGTVTSGVVHIPAEHNGLPVRVIYDPDNPFAGAFGWTGITSVHIPNSVTSIGDGAFRGCSSLATVDFAANSQLTSIGNGAFRDCSSLTSITIPSGVTSIGIWKNEYVPGPFEGCNNLTTVDFAANSQLTSIGFGAFRNCTSLTSITIPLGVTSIDRYAFEGCNSLATVDFAANSQLTSIGNGAFSGCSSLTSITIPSGITFIGDYAFGGCTSLNMVTFTGGSRNNGTFYYNSFPGDLISKIFGAYFDVYGGEGIGTYTRESGGEIWTKIY